jgi:hypothetical protein
MPGAQCTRSLACEIKQSTRASSPRVHRKNPAFPHAMVLTVYFVLSPAIGLSCHRRLANDGLSAPGWADLPPQDLTPASRRQDHTTSPSASAPFVLHASRKRSRQSRPAIPTRARRCRVHRIPSRVRDDREPPLLGRDNATNAVIWVFPEPKCFCREDWTGQISLICLQKLDFWRNCAMARRAGAWMKVS